MDAQHTKNIPSLAKRVRARRSVKQGPACRGCDRKGVHEPAIVGVRPHIRTAGGIDDLKRRGRGRGQIKHRLLIVPVAGGATICSPHLVPI